MTHGRFNFRDGGASRVACVVGRANECLHVTTTCATTVRTGSILCVLPPSFATRSPPGRHSRCPHRPPERIAAFREAERRGKKTRFRARRGDGDGGRGVGRTRGCPRRGPRPSRKGQFPFVMCSAKRPLAHARRVFPSRDGLAMEKSMPREH